MLECRDQRYAETGCTIVPARDRYHPTVVRSLLKTGWSIVKEQTYISIGSQPDTNRRLYIDLLVRQDDGLSILIEVKSLEKSPVHELMTLLGQYLVYRLALDYLEISTVLYVAIPQFAYHMTLQHTIGQQVMAHYAIPLLIFDPISEEITQWIPQP